MKTLTLLPLFLIITLNIHSQVITGNISDAKTGEMLEYASLGILNTPVGTITNDKGEFTLDVKGQPANAIIRISMMGYKAQTFSIEQLLKKQNSIQLVLEPVQIQEVVVKPSNKFKNIGTTSRSLRGMCGWGGDKRGKGHEIGLKIELGEKPVLLQKLNIRVHKQSYDSSLFRLHIRNIKDEMPNEELLNTNVLVVVTKTKGWQEIDLSKCNIVLKGNVVLSLEWLKVIGLNDNKLIRMNSDKQATANVLFSVKKGQGTLFAKWGVEAKWRKMENESPGIYLRVEE